MKNLAKQYHARVKVCVKVCGWCGCINSHYTGEHWDLHPEDVFLQVVDAPGLALRSVKCPQPCKEADEEEPCEDDGCTKGHHNCSISTNKETRVTTKERLVKPATTKSAARAVNTQELNEGQFIYQEAGNTSKATKYVDNTQGEPMTNRDLFDTAQSTDPAFLSRQAVLGPSNCLATRRAGQASSPGQPTLWKHWQPRATSSPRKG